MIEVVINYDPIKGYYKIYEASTDTLLGSANLTEAICLLSEFLKKSGIDLLSSTDIMYHLDSQTMVSIIEGNVNLLKQLANGPGSFVKSTQKFGSSSGSSGKSDNKKKRKRGGGFQGAKGFNESSRKFGFN